MIYLHNTATGKKQPFDALDSNRVTMYVCGPTVWAPPHIGNGRAAVVFDVLYRLLRYHFPTVVYAKNFTDIDEKIVNGAATAGQAIGEFVSGNIAAYEFATQNLNLLEPDIKPLATSAVSKMISMIDQLIDTGFAYVVDDHVYFDSSKHLLKFRNAPPETDYARVAPDHRKRVQSDFVMWRPAKTGEPTFVGPRGIIGIFSWHIECSAMIAQHLGPTIDIHGGGQDLIFPHHEAECAQSESCHGSPLAQYWVHNAMVLSNGQKMSKSLGNYITVADVLPRYSGEVLKFAMLQTHYRHPFDFKWERLEEAKTALRRIVNRIPEDVQQENMDEQFIDALRDDLNTPLAIKRLHEMPDGYLASALTLLGFSFRNTINILSVEDQQIFDERVEARHQKDWKKSDALRTQLLNRGIVVRDTASKSIWERL